MTTVKVNAHTDARSRFVDSPSVECLFSMTPLPRSACAPPPSRSEGAPAARGGGSLRNEHSNQIEHALPGTFRVNAHTDVHVVHTVRQLDVELSECSQ